MRPVSIFVMPMWDRLEFPYVAGQSVGDLKLLALEQARVEADPAQFMVKVRGAQILDESRPIGEVGVLPGSSIITLRRDRIAVR